jgi:hypothetical protein
MPEVLNARRALHRTPACSGPAARLPCARTQARAAARRPCAVHDRTALAARGAALAGLGARQAPTGLWLKYHTDWLHCSGQGCCPAGAGRDVAPLVLVEGAVLGGGAFSRVSIATGARSPQHPPRPACRAAAPAPPACRPSPRSWPSLHATHSRGRLHASPEGSCFIVVMLIHVKVLNQLNPATFMLPDRPGGRRRGAQRRHRGGSTR